MCEKYGGGKMYDIIIKNGHVIDTYNEMDQIMDVAIDNGKIVGVGHYNENEAAHKIDATGCIVTPGLIDFHAHLYPMTEIGIPAEPVCFSSGVTTVVDAGSAGCATYEGHRGFIASSKLRIKSFLHVCSAGLATGRYLENPDPKDYDEKKISRLVNLYKHEIVGLKIRQGAEIVGGLGLEPLKETIRIAEKLGVPVMVHCSNPPGKLSDMINLLRKGDILTHAYQNKGNSIIDSDGLVCKSAWEARKRGVIFDVANANIHFSFDVANQALKEKFLPDTISTDLTMRSLYKRPAVFNLLHVMAKYLNMGLTINEVIERCTIIPAKLLGIEGETGNFNSGTFADVAVLKVVEKNVQFGDREGKLLLGNKLIRNMMTIKDGEIVFRDIEF